MNNVQRYIYCVGVSARCAMAAWFAAVAASLDRFRSASGKDMSMTEICYCYRVRLRTGFLLALNLLYSSLDLGELKALFRNLVRGNTTKLGQ